MAYGFTAEQVLPTLRMLGDVSAAMPDRLPIGDAAYLYGTLRSQGRAYARDVLQFSNRGISIIHQELSLAPNLSVRDNIFMGRELRKPGFLGNVLRMMDKKAMLETAITA